MWKTITNVFKIPLSYWKVYLNEGYGYLYSISHDLIKCIYKCTTWFILIILNIAMCVCVQSVFCVGISASFHVAF